MHRATLSTLLVLTACAGRFRTEHVGQAQAAVVPRAAADARAAGAGPALGGIDLPRGTYDLALHFDVPRAQVVDWKVACPGAEVTGSVGEPFAAYRARRLAALRAERDQERRTVGALTGAVIGAAVPSASAAGEVVTPDGRATATAAVDGRAAGAAAGTAIANAAVPDDVALPPGDLGQSRLTAHVHVTTAASGACTVTAVADGAGVRGGFDVSRVRDLDAEARLRAMAANTAARHVRTELTAHLVALGADPDGAAKRRAAEARLAAEAEARREARAAQARARRYQLEVSAEADANARRQAKLAIEIRRRQITLAIRAELRAQLVMWGADPDRHARLVAEARAERDARARRAALAAEAERRRCEAADEARRRHDAELEEARRRREEAAAEARRAREVQLAELAAAHRQQALEVRGQLIGFLVSIGAHERPPMPAPRPEAPGPRPFAGAVWIAGHWTWTGSLWAWTRGGWTDNDRFGDAGGAAPVAVAPAGPPEPVEPAGTVVVPGGPVEPPVVIGIGVGLPGGDGGGQAVRDHRAARPPAAPAGGVRDHRSGAPRPPATRDHRRPQAPRVRDHRR